MCKGQEAVFGNVRWLHAESGCDCVVQTQQPRGLRELPTVMSLVTSQGRCLNVWEELGGGWGICFAFIVAAS